MGNCKHKMTRHSITGDDVCQIKAKCNQKLSLEIRDNYGTIFQRLDLGFYGDSSKMFRSNQFLENIEGNYI